MSLTSSVSIRHADETQEAGKDGVWGVVQTVVLVAGLAGPLAS